MEDKTILETSSREVNAITTQTSQDAQDMARLGKKQELKRNFRDLSILGLTCMMMGTWEAMVTTATFSLINGGLAGTIWIYVGVWLSTICVVLSMAEMASMAPTSGGQYHWVSEFGPPQHQKFLSYVVGWLSALGWQTGVATTAFASGGILQGVIYLNYPDYVAEQWHGTLLTIAVALVAFFVNTIGAKHLPMMEAVILFMHTFGFFVILIPLWVLAPRTTASKVFGEFSNFGGWSSIGGATIVGMITPVGSFGGYDAAAHMAEEVRDASKVVPRAMIITILLNGLMGFVMIITFCFCITDLETLLSLPVAFPFVEVFKSATGSVTGATLMSIVIIVLTMCTCMSGLAAASRQVFAFARDEGLPASNTWKKVSVIGTEIPLNSVLISLTIAVLMSLVNLGSTTAFNSIVGLLNGSAGTAYALSLACLLWRRTRSPEPLPPARFSLGKWGLPLNIFSLFYVTMATTVGFFPVMKQVTVQTMNWSSVVYAGVMAIAMVAYFCGGRQRYKGPVVYVQKERY
ncbi:Amino acid/polyamine transporter I [Macrophomina phaseolina MS6]|uniref:Amino acid/polyamine transporter I n=1 Tax=Macrophomina phaseolina (strain MS6) TaxID=1126212 RepID=K2SWM2_MACPH|nr:Amino acid/polyamine transporter I [Macrophomina phaseolina MS6]